MEPHVTRSTVTIELVVNVSSTSNYINSITSGVIAKDHSSQMYPSSFLFFCIFSTESNQNIFGMFQKQEKNDFIGKDFIKYKFT